MSSALAPGLLLAAPQLGDPNFERTVVLIGRHGDDGALGWVINGKPLATVGTLLRDSSLVPDGVTLPRSDAFERVARVGGPVAPGTGWILYPRGEEALPGEIDVGPDLAITGDMNALDAVMRGGRPDDFRLLLGYAGWGPGQLEGEIGAGGWLPVGVDARLILDVSADQLWDAAYQRFIGRAPAAFTGNRRGQA